jgi:hypothetical protein
LGSYFNRVTKKDNCSLVDAIALPGELMIDFNPVDLQDLDISKLVAKVSEVTLVNPFL